MNKMYKLIIGLLVLVLVAVISAAIIAKNQEKSICGKQLFGESTVEVVYSAKETSCKSNSLVVVNKDSEPVELSIVRLEKVEEKFTATDDVQAYTIAGKEKQTITTANGRDFYSYKFTVEDGQDYTYTFK